MKRGNRFYMWTASAGEPLQFAGGSTLVPLTGDYYVGIGVCAHNKDAVQKASFSNVEIVTGRQPAPKPTRYSTLETIAVASTDARATYVSTDVIESPNWSPDGKTLLFNSNGGIQRVAVAGGKAETVQTGLTGCNSSHGISPDGTLIGRERGVAVAMVSRRSILCLRAEASRNDWRRSRLRSFTGGHQTGARFPSAGWRTASRTSIRSRRPAGKRRNLRKPVSVQRWTGVLAGREVHLFQLRSQRLDADLAHEDRWERATTGDHR